MEHRLRLGVHLHGGGGRAAWVAAYPEAASIAPLRSAAQPARLVHLCLAGEAQELRAHAVKHARGTARYAPYTARHARELLGACGGAAGGASSVAAQAGASSRGAARSPKLQAPTATISTTCPRLNIILKEQCRGNLFAASPKELAWGRVHGVWGSRPCGAVDHGVDHHAPVACCGWWGSGWF